jgi:hypothetical protein
MIKQGIEKFHELLNNRALEGVNRQKVETKRAGWGLTA